LIEHRAPPPLDIAGAVAHNARRLLSRPHHAMIQRNTQTAINWRSRSAAGDEFAFRFGFYFSFSAARGAGSATT
jgi:hypothetical protein